MKPIEVTELCRAASVELSGCVRWGEPVPHRGPGVYVIVAPERLNEQAIVYVGRSKDLRDRLGRFYRHKYGRRSPHRGGQEILLLLGPRIVHWAATEEYASAEDRLIRTFEDMAGGKPLGNRMQSARLRPVRAEDGATGLAKPDGDGPAG